MLNILLGILKIIGILLLTVLSLIFILVLILLLGPICYRVSGEYREEKAFSGSISWIFFVLRARVEYVKEKGLLWGVRIFGILVASNEEEFLEKKAEKQRLQEERRRLKEEKKASLNKGEESFGIEDRKPAEEISEPVKALEEAEKISEPAKVSEEASEPMNQKEEETNCKVEPLEENIGISKKESPDEPVKKPLSLKIKEKYILIKNRIKELIQKIKAIPDKIKKGIEGIKAKIQNLKAKIRKILEWKEFFLGERNREGFLHVLHNLKKMILHILPRKLQGKVEFGVEDPYVMGQILTVLSIFYPVYQEKFTVIPDFENPGFAGDASLKGRIIPGYLVVRLLIALCNKEVIHIIKEGRRLAGGNKA